MDQCCLPHIYFKRATFMNGVTEKTMIGIKQKGCSLPRSCQPKTASCLWRARHALFSCSHALFSCASVRPRAFIGPGLMARGPRLMPRCTTLCFSKWKLPPVSASVVEMSPVAVCPESGTNDLIMRFTFQRLTYNYRTHPCICMRTHGS